MNNIGIIASVIAAVVAIITLFFTIRNSKGNVIKRIERKQQEIQDLDNEFFRLYGPNANMRMHYPTQIKREKLEKEIAELRKRI